MSVASDYGDLLRTEWSEPIKPLYARVELQTIIDAGDLKSWSKRKLRARWRWSFAKTASLWDQMTGESHRSSVPVASESRSSSTQTSQSANVGAQPVALELRDDSASRTPASAPGSTVIPPPPPTGESPPHGGEVTSRPEIKPSHAHEVFLYWKAWHPGARKLSTGDRTLINARIRESSIADCKLVIRWAHEAGDASFFRGENDRGKKYLGLPTLMKSKGWSSRLGDATDWKDRGYQDLRPKSSAQDASVADRAWARLKGVSGMDSPPGDGWHFSTNKDPRFDSMAIDAVRSVWGSWREMGSDTGLDFKAKQFKQAFLESYGRRTTP
jgi:hypothetical protein